MNPKTLQSTELPMPENDALTISVVTVSFNSAATIARTVESFLAQDYPNKELLVIDGASTDGTLDVLARHDDPAITVISEPDDGIYDAMNKGLLRYGGDAVGFLNSDDRFHDNNALATIAAGLLESDIVFGDLVFVDDHDRSKVVRRWRGSPFEEGAFRTGWMPAHPSFYVRRHVAQTVGLFDTSLRIAADYDYMLRCLELYHYPANYLNRILVHMKRGGASTAGPGAYVRGNLEALRSRRQHLQSGLIDLTLFRKPLRKLPQLFNVKEG